MTHGWHFLHLFVCSSSGRVISDLHPREGAGVYIPAAPGLLILTKLPEFAHWVCLGCARVEVVQGGCATKQQVKVLSLPWEPDLLWERGHRDMLCGSCTYF